MLKSLWLRWVQSCWASDCPTMASLCHRLLQVRFEITRMKFLWKASYYRSVCTFLLVADDVAPGCCVVRRVPSGMVGSRQHTLICPYLRFSAESWIWERLTQTIHLLISSRSKQAAAREDSFSTAYQEARPLAYPLRPGVQTLLRSRPISKIRDAEAQEL